MRNNTINSTSNNWEKNKTSYKKARSKLKFLLLDYLNNKTNTEDLTN